MILVYNYYTIWKHFFRTQNIKIATQINEGYYLMNNIWGLYIVNTNIIIMFTFLLLYKYFNITKIKVWVEWYSWRQPAWSSDGAWSGWQTTYVEQDQENMNVERKQGSFQRIIWKDVGFVW